MEVKKTEEAEFSILWGAGSGILAFVFMAIVLVYGADITSGIGDDFTTGSYAANITTQTLEGMETIGNKQRSIGSILAISIIIGLLIFAFGGFVGGRMR